MNREEQPREGNRKRTPKDALAWEQVQIEADQAVDLEARITELEAIIAKLPVTSDGVPVVPKVDKVYLWISGEIRSAHVDKCFDDWGVNAGDKWVMMSDCYSTYDACFRADTVESLKTRNTELEAFVKEVAACRGQTPDGYDTFWAGETLVMRAEQLLREYGCEHNWWYGHGTPFEYCTKCGATK